MIVFAALWAALSVGCAPINVISHNEFADVLVRHVGHELAGDSTYGGGTQSVIDWLASVPTDTTSVALNDGSGLSHDNRVSARTIVDLTHFMLGTPQGQAWVRTFAVGGMRGTLGSRLTGPNTLGRVWGKTGSLTGVITTSGLVFNRHDGRRYLFSILMNDVGSTTGVRDVHDQVIGIAARDHWSDGLRPDAPVLTAVRAAESDVIEIEWTRDLGRRDKYRGGAHGSAARGIASGPLKGSRGFLPSQESIPRSGCRGAPRGRARDLGRFD